MLEIYLGEDVYVRRLSDSIDIREYHGTSPSEYEGVNFLPNQWFRFCEDWEYIKRKMNRAKTPTCVWQYDDITIYYWPFQKILGFSRGGFPHSIDLNESQIEVLGQNLRGTLVDEWWSNARFYCYNQRKLF